MGIFSKMMEGKTLLICWLILVAVLFLVFLIPALSRGDQGDIVSIFWVFGIIEGIILVIGIIGLNWIKITTVTREFYVHHPMVVYGFFLIILIISVILTVLVPFPINIIYFIIDIIMVMILLSILPARYSLILILIGVSALFIFFLITKTSDLTGYIGIVVVSTLIALMFVCLGYSKRKEWQRRREQQKMSGVKSL